MIQMIKEGIAFDNAVNLYIPEYAMNTEEMPVIIMQDGQHAFDHKDKALRLHEIIEKHHIHVAVLSIDNIYEQRFNEYMPYEAGAFSIDARGLRVAINPQGKMYAKWLVERVIPVIERDYEIKFSEKYLAGISLGAVISLYTLLEYPEVFDGVISISGSYDLNLEKLEELIKEAELNHKSVYIDYGSAEFVEEHYRTEKFIEANQRIANLLMQAGAEVTLETFKYNTHRYEYFRPRIQQAILNMIEVKTYR